MIIRAGYSIGYDCPKPTPTLLALRIHSSRRSDLLTPEALTFSPPLKTRDYTDKFGNICTRLTAPPGRLTISTEFVFDSGVPDAVPINAVQHDIEELPDDVLVYLLSSRYVETDVLSNIAWQQFEATQPGWPRVQAILDFVHRHIRFYYLQADNMRSAYGGLSATGWRLPRFCHLAIAFCRCMNIPARYCTGYLGDIGVPPNEAPMDFSAWFEVYLGGKWQTADARHNKPRIGRILMARGRDATEVTLSTQFGPAALAGFSVTTEEVDRPGIKRAV